MSNAPAVIVLLQTLSTLYMAGLIWFVQVVHYPLFAQATGPSYITYQAQHMARTTWVVGPPMLVEAATTAALLLIRPRWFPVWSAWAGAALLAVVWLSTAALQVPQHETLTHGFDPGAHRFLVASNWVRTVAWSARALLLAGVLWPLLTRP